MVIGLPNSSSLEEREPALHEKDDDSHDDEEKGVRVEHQHLQVLVQALQGQDRGVRHACHCSLRHVARCS